MQRFSQPFPLRWRSFATIRGSRSIGFDREPAVLESARAGFKGKPNLLAKRLCSDRQRIDKSSLNSFCQRTVTKPSFILAPIDGEREVGPTLCRGIARIIYDAEKPVINGVACITSFWLTRADEWMENEKHRRETSHWSGAHKESLHHWQFNKSFQRNIFCIHSKLSWGSDRRSVSQLFFFVKITDAVVVVYGEKVSA